MSEEQKEVKDEQENTARSEAMAVLEMGGPDIASASADAGTTRSPRRLASGQSRMTPSVRGSACWHTTMLSAAIRSIADSITWSSPT